MATEILRSRWRIPRWMRWVVVILVALIAFVLIMFVSGHGDDLPTIATTIWEGIKSIWLWVIGLFGGVLALFKGKGGTSIKEDKDAILKEQERIGNALEDLKQQRNDVDGFLARERELHQRELDLLNRELALKQQEMQATREKLDQLSNMTGPEFFAALPQEKQAKIRQMLDNSGNDL